MNRQIAIVLLVLFLACTSRTGNVPAIDPVKDLAAVSAADSAWLAACITRSPVQIRAFYAPNARADFTSGLFRGVDAIAEHWSKAFADTSFYGGLDDGACRTRAGNKLGIYDRHISSAQCRRRQIWAVLRGVAEASRWVLACSH